MPWPGLKRIPNPDRVMEKLDLGSLRGRVAFFLVSSLKAGTQEKYDQERASFSSDLKVRGLDIDTLPEDVLDWVLAERISTSTRSANRPKASVGGPSF